MKFHFFTLLVIASFLSYSQTVTDVDGNVYNTVKIGNQEWMAGNLRTTHYNDSSAILFGESLFSWSAIKKGAYAYYGYSESEYKDTYGAIYNWLAVSTEKLCPSGWHVPSDADWTALEKFLGENGHKGSEGGALKDTTGWKENGNGTNDYGFNGKAGGFFSNNGSFNGIGSYGYYWTSTKDPILNAHYRRLSKKDGAILKNSTFQLQGFSVRCLKK